MKYATPWLPILLLAMKKKKEQDEKCTREELKDLCKAHGLKFEDKAELEAEPTPEKGGKKGKPLKESAPK